MDSVNPAVKHIVTIVLLVLLVPSVSFAKSKIEKQSFSSNRKNRTFYLFVPEAVNGASSVPLLLVFHGSNHNGLSLVEKWRDLADKENFIVAGLDSADSSVWSTTADNPGVLHDLVVTLESKYPIDPKRVYLFGHSGGAVFALLVSMMQSEYFAATAVHAGSWRERKEFDVMRDARRKIPIAIWVGTRDPFFSVESVRKTRDALTAGGFPVQVTEMPGHDHWYYDLAPKINEVAWQFLKQYELPSAPRFQDVVEVSEATSETADANTLINEINSSQARAMELLNSANQIESQMIGKSIDSGREELQKLAAQQIELFQESAAMVKTAAEKAERAAQMKIGARNQAHLHTSARYYLKFAELLDARRVGAEILLGTDSAETINAKRAEAMQKIQLLQREVEELRLQAGQINK